MKIKDVQLGTFAKIKTFIKKSTNNDVYTAAEISDGTGVNPNLVSAIMVNHHEISRYKLDGRTNVYGKAKAIENLIKIQGGSVK